MTLQSHLYLCNAIHATSQESKRDKNKIKRTMESTMILVVMMVLSVVDARPKAMGIAVPVSHNVCCRGEVVFQCV